MTMSLKVYNYLTRSLTEFVPLHEGLVTMYVCGPTVYNHAHIGHAKAYVSFDIVVRYLRFLGYKVRYVQNITDVGHLTDDADAGEDKILKRARLDRVEPMEVVETYMRSYYEDMDALNVTRPNIAPRPSGHIPEQLELIATLLEKGYAYEVNGSVYFSVDAFPEYGKLSGRKTDELQESSRVEANPDKRNPQDFALWKKAESSHIMKWASPYGVGYPGWHIECSVMAMKYLGETIDIHGGGLENIFPHNESEVAQAEAATGKQFVRYWLLNNMVTVNGTKMGKSLGNFTTIKQALSRHHPLVIRMFILSSHYRSQTDFSEEAMTAAGKGLERLLATVRYVRSALVDALAGPLDQDVASMIADHKTRFLTAMDDDFNTPIALSVMFDFNRNVNCLVNAGQPSRATYEQIDDFYRTMGGTILGIIPNELTQQAGSGLEDKLTQLVIELRHQSRAKKDWAMADMIRNRLADMGVVLEDCPLGTKWRLKSLAPEVETE